MDGIWFGALVFEDHSLLFGLVDGYEPHIDKWLEYNDCFGLVGVERDGHGKSILVYDFEFVFIVA